MSITPADILVYARLATKAVDMVQQMAEALGRDEPMTQAEIDEMLLRRAEVDDEFDRLRAEAKARLEGPSPQFGGGGGP